MQCSNCGAPIIRGRASRMLNCDYCGQALNNGRNILFFKSLSIGFNKAGNFIGSGIGQIGRRINEQSWNSRKRSNESFSYNIQNTRQRLRNLFKRPNAKIISVVLLLSGISILYIKKK